MVWNQWLGQAWQLHVNLHSRQLLLYNCIYLSEDVSRHSSGHEDGAELLQQATLIHGFLTAGCGSGGIHWRHHDSNQLRIQQKAQSNSTRLLCWLSLKFSLSGRQIRPFCLPAAWGEGWWPFVQTSPSCRRQPQTTASSSGCKSPPWRNSDWSCCSSAGWATAANSPPPQYLHGEPTIYIQTPTGSSILHWNPDSFYLRHCCPPLWWYQGDAQTRFQTPQFSEWRHCFWWAAEVATNPVGYKNKIFKGNINKHNAFAQKENKSQRCSKHSRQ